MLNQANIESSWNIVQRARAKERPNGRIFIENILDDFVELHGDRLYGDDLATIGGIGMLGGIPVTIIAQNKGMDLNENIACNYGMSSPEGYRKSLRLMKEAEKFNRPIILLVDTPGAFCGIEAEERGQGEAIARNLFEMSSLAVPILSIILGEGGSGGALALAVADEVWMMENGIYSILSPEGFASILWKDSKRAKEAAAMMKITAQDLLRLNIIDKVINEVEGIEEMPYAYLRNEIEKFLYKYQELDKECLVENRYQRFRRF